jgi:hypothetical protein
MQWHIIAVLCTRLSQSSDVSAKGEYIGGWFVVDLALGIIFVTPSSDGLRGVRNLANNRLSPGDCLLTAFWDVPCLRWGG